VLGSGTLSTTAGRSSAASVRRFGQRSIALAATGPWAPSTNGDLQQRYPLVNVYIVENHHFIAG
jgi:hypothetical protein